MKFKSTSIVCAIAAAAMSLASVSAFAQGNDYRNQRGAQQRNDQRDFSPGRDSGPRGYDNHNEARNDRNFGARGPQFRRGGHIPAEYRNRQYYVTDWRAHHLAPPPRGQQWVQVGADYALIAVATGLIANLVLNN